jgi:signal peptidase I
MEQAHTSHTASTLPQKKKSSFGELLRFALIALIIVVPIRLFIAQPFVVSGASMEPTFANGEYLIVDQVSYRFGEPERGDVVIFQYPRDPSKYFIKRIIALPGETIVIRGDRVTIFNARHPDGMALDEPYVTDMETAATFTETLADDEYFVMGDNRDHSSDSRTWGVLEHDLIVGQAFLRLLPISGLTLLPGEPDTNR